MGHEKRKMLRGELYRADDPELVADRRRCRLLVEKFNATSVDEPELRMRLLRALLGSLGDGADIKPPLECDYGYNISVGAGTFINYGAIILDCAAVIIGDDVQIAPAVQLLGATHPLDADVRRSGLESASPISVGDGVWLGGGVIVCPGVNIGSDTVVGAGSVVTRDLPEGALAAGNPCRVIRDLKQGKSPAAE